MAAPVLQAVNGFQDANATAGGFTATFPSGLAAGDLMILAVSVWHTAATVNTPAGWTAAPDNGTAGTGSFTAKTYVFIKTATGTDVSAGSVAVTFSGSFDYWSWSIARISGADPSTPIHAHGATGSSSNGSTATAPSLVTTVDNCLIVECWHSSSTAAASPAAITPPTTNDVAHTSGGGWCGVGISHQTQTTHGATGGTSASLSHAGSWVGVTLAIQPPVSSGAYSGWGIPL